MLAYQLNITVDDGWATSNFDGMANAHPCPTLANIQLTIETVVCW